ncbi:MAG: AMP-binding protein, partial [Legionellales bacterium]|nr:AMP-binding protein [Legionellales bacterium]
MSSTLMNDKIRFYCHILGNAIHIKKILTQLLKDQHPIKGLITQDPTLSQWANEQAIQPITSIDQLNATDFIFCMLAGEDTTPIELNNHHLLLVSDYKKLIVHWNDTQRNDYLGKTIIELIDSQAQKNPDNIAVIAAHQSLHYEALTYKALQHRTNQLAQYLSNYVIAPHQAIALCVDRGVNMITGILGIMKAGAAYVPLSPDYPQERLMFIVNDAQPTHLLIDDQHMDLFSKCNINKITFSELNQIISTEELSCPQTRVEPDTLAYIMYTSGSTGLPGVGLQGPQGPQGFQGFQGF